MIFSNYIYLMRKTLAAILAMLLSLTVALGLGEAFIRLIYGKQMNMFPRYHSAVNYGPYSSRRIRPNTEFNHKSQDGEFYFITNNKGFRDERSIQYSKPEGEYRIVVLGDSHTQGYEVNQYETYSVLLEKTLLSKGHTIRVINAGVSGFSTAEALVFLEQEGYKYEPDAIVLGFFANDYSDNIKDGLFKLQQDSLFEASTSFQPGVKLQDFIYQFGLVRWLSEHSYLYSFAFNSVWDLSKQWLIRTQMEKESGNKNSIQVPPKEYAVGMQEASKEEVELALALLERMHQFCLKKSIPFIVIDIPQLPFRSSIPMNQEFRFHEVCDTLLSSRSMLQQYRKLPRTHVPHGHNHLSAEAHALIGVQAGLVLDSYIQAR
jgi:hypothetical protein